jgi:hypothetical protein
MQGANIDGEYGDWFERDPTHVNAYPKNPRTVVMMKSIRSIKAVIVDVNTPAKTAPRVIEMKN